MTEYAMIMKADGSQVSHPDARQRAVEFLRALAAQPTAAAPIGRNGTPQAWNRERGFHDSSDPAATTIERRPASANPLDPAWVRRMESESRRRRAERAAADRRLDAPLTDQGQIVAALRRGL